MPRRPFPLADLYCITAREYSLGRSNVEVVKLLLESGIKIIQYREKDLPTLAKYNECLAIREMTAAYGAVFIVDDYVDLALAAGADGVHVGQEDLPAQKTRELVGEGMFVGMSTHSPEQARQAEESGLVDYIGVGPLYRTFTKKDVQAPVGLGYLDHVVATRRLPFVAIGGIKEHNVAEVVRHGASCVCMVTEIVGAGDIGAKIRAVREIIERTRREARRQ